MGERRRTVLVLGPYSFVMSCAKLGEDTPGSGQLSVLLATPSLRCWTPCRVARTSDFTVKTLLVHQVREPEGDERNIEG